MLKDNDIGSVRLVTEMQPEQQPREPNLEDEKRCDEDDNLCPAQTQPRPKDDEWQDRLWDLINPKSLRMGRQTEPALQRACPDISEHGPSREFSTCPRFDAKQ